MKLLGKLNARWWGNDEDRVDKEIFLRPFEAIESPVFILPRGAPHRVVIGLETIRAKKLDKYRPLSICGGGEPHVPIKTSEEARRARGSIRKIKSEASHKAQVTKHLNDSKERKERKEEERRKEEESKKKKKKQEEERKKKEEEERKRKKKKEEERKRP
ncbi:hypothetical protein NpNSSI1_00007550 [Neofusicoccum parvum]|nr:hypothetical protein NpNSSI1_00007550 [Neofusicoccum parvum]